MVNKTFVMIYDPWISFIVLQTRYLYKEKKKMHC